MKTWQIVLLVLGIVLVGVIVIPSLVSTKIVNNTIDEAKNSANQRTARLIISSVELAYSEAYLNNKGQKPTLQQVKKTFNSNAAIWNKDNVIEAQNFNCDVKVENNNLKVSCLDSQTNSSLILSSN